MSWKEKVKYRIERFKWMKKVNNHFNKTYPRKERLRDYYDVLMNLIWGVNKFDQFILPGMIYLDCANHPVLCIRNDGWDVEGISLIDGSRPRSCSIRNCGVTRLSFKEFIYMRDNWKEIYSEMADNMIRGGWWDEEVRTKYKNFY